MKPKKTSLAKELAQEEGKLRVTVCVQPPKVLEARSINRELRYVRSCLLYADEVLLISPTVALLNAMEPLMHVDADDPWRGLRQLPKESWEYLADGKSSKALKKKLSFIEHAAAHDPERTRALSEWRATSRHALVKAQHKYQQCDAPELALAQSDGALRIIHDEFSHEDDSAAHREWFKRQMAQAWSDPTGTLLLDQRARKSIAKRPALKELAPGARNNRAIRATTGTGLIEMLPTFPRAPMADILDVRRDLTSARRSYRASVRSLSEKLSSNALDPELDSEIEEFWMEDVRPKIQAMSHQASALGIGKTTLRSAAKELLTKAGGSGLFGVGLTQLSEFTNLTVSPGAVLGAASTGAGWACSEAAKAAIEEHQNRKNFEWAYLTNIDSRLRRRI